MNTEPTPEQQYQNELEQARMSILEHLAELRTRLLYAIIAIIIGAAVAWIWGEQILTFLMAPLE